jgi:hypothetical protein
VPTRYSGTFIVPHGCHPDTNFMPRRSPEMVGVPKEDWDTVPDRFNADMEKYRIALRHRIIWAQRPE